jgi:pSer/pThr/pTyr-binding forkhead associated (FHA) protein
MSPCRFAPLPYEPEAHRHLRPNEGNGFRYADGEVSVGRDPANAVRINDPSVSRRHCLIRCEAGACRVEDLDSFNGTFVNGIPVKAQPLADVTA